MNRLSLTALVLATAACATPPTTPPPRQPETPPIAPSLPYPETTPNEQFEQLAIQVSRLENQVAELQERVEQLEQRLAASVKRPTRVHSNKPIAPPFANHQGSLKTENASSRLEKAQQQYRAQQYQAATATLREADSGGDGSETAQKSMFLLLQAHQKLNHCQSVINIGQRYATRFSGSLNAPEALSLVAQCQWRIQQQDIARDTWRKIIQQYPKSPAASRARNQIKQR
ncbi:tetratricopeptide repeat protein [Kingella oralis]|uniref:tetratricopeptide repeat protein n=1 Tax=Kingella oralis TaxID=505 RepID=UPI0034E514C9